MRIAIAGPPNVGKSVIFSALTGVGTITSNYPGTTVEYLEGEAIFHGEKVTVIDLPGIYSLAGGSEDERVATELLAQSPPDKVIVVMDATRLEPCLVLLFQIIELGYPAIVALNFMDVARKRHTTDLEQLSAIVGLPVVPMTAITGEGVEDLIRVVLQTATVSDHKVHYRSEIESLISVMLEASQGTHLGFAPRGAAIKLLEGNPYFTSHYPEEAKALAEQARMDFKKEHNETLEVHINRDRYGEAGTIIAKVVARVPHQRSRKERISDLTLRPITGIPILLCILGLIFLSVVFLGGFLESLLLGIYIPATQGFFDWLAQAIGGQFGAAISAGLNMSIQAILAIVIPYILVFYLILALLEDSGYLPRVVILLDGVMHRIGLHGRAIIPMVVGTGCNVPAILSTRVIESRRERLILSAIIIMAVPCSAQTAVIMGTVGAFAGLLPAMAIFVILLGLVLLAGMLFHRFLKFEPTALLFEIPDLTVPRLNNVLSKTWARINDFFIVAFPILLVGSLILELLMQYGVLDALVDPLAWLTVGLLGLPAVTIIALIFGIMRKEMALQLLVILFGTADLATVMTPQQLFIFALVMATYMPCMSAFAVMGREFGWKDATKVAVASLCTALLMGMTANLLLNVL
jgi:ferrous iron transport protein B